MGTPGSESAKLAPEVAAEHTVRALQRTVPAAVPAIGFLSGGQCEEEAALNLNAMNKLQGEEAMVAGRSTLEAWAGEEENVEKARTAFLARCKAQHLGRTRVMLLGVEVSQRASMSRTTSIDHSLPTPFFFLFVMTSEVEVMPEPGIFNSVDDSIAQDWKMSSSSSVDDRISQIRGHIMIKSMGVSHRS
ncbi:fructose-bisphosphate aldolase, cytoplasmic [Musa troglodytarum]|uniref:fructose-bisphosphate aldolase n=1 Tax=Musa troglodytarum TaxID=320322 RepID=A0A9E7ESR0_9LILI|nr:fructose-bisphosphate aldolase, cytoplasmic [Musa troglodytarum]